MIEHVDIRELAAQMIESLAEDPETGYCRICDQHKHAVDCKLILIVQGLRQAVARKL